jgi:hypothetical protein
VRRLYLDYNCFQRRFDDQRQPRIRGEAQACVFILEQAGSEVELVWSFMHEDENAFCPFPARRVEVGRLTERCAISIRPVEAVRRRAHELQGIGNLSAKDALHVACAVQAKADWFLTCDDQLLRRFARLNLGLRAANPVAYLSAQQF